MAARGVPRTARIATAAGAPLLASELSRGIESISFLDGRGRFVGPTGGDWTTREGDPGVFDAVNATPEIALVPLLKQALIERGIDDGLVTHDGRSPANPQWWDGIYHHLAYGESAGFFSWAFWATTSVIITSEADPHHGPAAGYMQAGFAAPESFWGYGYQYFHRQWWGAYVTIGNDLYPLCSVDGSRCQNTTMLMQHY